MSDLYVVIGEIEYGAEYAEDVPSTATWLVAAYPDEATAQRHREEAETWLHEAIAPHLHAARRAHRALVPIPKPARENPWDPHMRWEGEPPEYRVEPVRFETRLWW